VLAGAIPSPSGEGAHVLPGTSSQDTTSRRWLRAPDGAGLWRLLRDTDLV
jgi:hypothetical protein